MTQQTADRVIETIKMELEKEITHKELSPEQQDKLEHCVKHPFTEFYQIDFVAGTPDAIYDYEDDNGDLIFARVTQEFMLKSLIRVLIPINSHQHQRKQDVRKQDVLRGLKKLYQWIEEMDGPDTDTEEKEFPF